MSNITRYIAVEEAGTGSIYLVQSIDDEMAHVWLYAPDTINIYDRIAGLEMGDDDDRAHQVGGLYPAALDIIVDAGWSVDNRYTIIASYYRCQRDRPVDGIDAHLHGASASGLRALGITDTTRTGTPRRDISYIAVEDTDGTILIYGRDDEPAWTWQRTDGGDSLIDGLCRCVLQGTSPGTTMATTVYTMDAHNDSRMRRLYCAPMIASAYTKDQGTDQYVTIYPWRASETMRRNMGITCGDTSGIWHRPMLPGKKKNEIKYIAIEYLCSLGLIQVVDGYMTRLWAYKYFISPHNNDLSRGMETIYDEIAHVETGKDDDMPEIEPCYHDAAMTWVAATAMSYGGYRVIAYGGSGPGDQHIAGIEVMLHMISDVGLVQVVGVYDATRGPIPRRDISYTAAEDTDGTVWIYGRDDEPAWQWRQPEGGGDSLIDGLCRCALRGTSPDTTMITTAHTGDISSLYRLPVIASAYTEDQGARQYLHAYPWRASAAMRHNIGITCDTSQIWPNG